MRQHKQTGSGRVNQAEQTTRDQEVVRANRELTAYFKGQRTEREARAALKIIKAFVRDREHLDPKTRPPLPGLAAPPADPGPRERKPKRRKTKTKKARREAESLNQTTATEASTAEPTDREG